MFKKLSLLLLFSAFLIGLTACGNTTGTTPDEFFKVSFFADGGVPEPEAQLIPKGGLINLPEEYLKSASMLILSLGVFVLFLRDSFTKTPAKLY